MSWVALAQERPLQSGEYLFASRLNEVLRFWCRGAGPVGLLTIMWAKYRGAKRIFSIDCVEARLATARSQGAETVDFSKENVIDAMQKLIPGPLFSLQCRERNGRFISSRRS